MAVPDRTIVCAACKHPTGIIVCGPRHFDLTMRVQMKALHLVDWQLAEEGFVDQRGEFLTREEAWVIAVANNQIKRRVGGDEGRLYSENLY